MSLLPASEMRFEAHVPIAIVGGGACGLVAALAVRDSGLDCLVLERDSVPAGNTALSSGMIPACGTRLQTERGIADTPEIMAADIQAKARGTADPAIVEAICRQSGATVDWLMAHHAIELELVEGFLYPGHSRRRMHAPPSRTGAALIGALAEGAVTAGVDLLTDARVSDLVVDSDGRICGLHAERPDGSREAVGCEVLILACNGFGGNPDLVRRHIPVMADALYFGHTGNTGDAVRWGEQLGADLKCLGAYQGHASVATPHNSLITWAVIMEGGIQVNRAGRRFSDETRGYSEQARAVLEQPGGIAFMIYDERLHRLAGDFEDYREAERAGAVKSGPDEAAIAEELSLPADALTATLQDVRACADRLASDCFGREFKPDKTLAPPYFGIRVTGALFHTQGGLTIDPSARVLSCEGRPFPNLYAGGGAACGISGPADWGYLSGNGLLTATVLGRQAGHSASRQVRDSD